LEGEGSRTAAFFFLLPFTFGRSVSLSSAEERRRRSFARGIT